MLPTENKHLHEIMWLVLARLPLEPHAFHSVRASLVSISCAFCWDLSLFKLTLINKFGSIANLRMFYIHSVTSMNKLNPHCWDCICWTEPFSIECRQLIAFAWALHCFTLWLASITHAPLFQPIISKTNNCNYCKLHVFHTCTHFPHLMRVACNYSKSWLVHWVLWLVRSLLPWFSFWDTRLKTAPIIIVSTIVELACLMPKH